MLPPLQAGRQVLKVHAATASSSSAKNRSVPVKQHSKPKPHSKEGHSSHGSTPTPTSITGSDVPRQRVRRGAASTATRSNGSSRSSSTGSRGATADVDARKNPELYSLTAVNAAEDSQTQQTPVRSPADLSAAQPWPSTSIQGGVGTTGAYSSEPALPQQQQQQQQQAASVSSGRSTGLQQPLLQQKPEVLAPAGGWPQLRAAVENGADAVYFGVTGFNARARAANFTPEELPDVMHYLRGRGVKGYVALNVLVFDEELQQLEEVIRHLATAGVDALIVQDVGAVALAQRVAPHLPIHGSTQMSITSAEGAEFAASLGVSRVVVGRELSVREIAKVASNTSTEVEAFCHGALCVSYSGQCFSSEAWGGRSANRGQCAQACRMPYGLIVDGEFKDLKDVSYLLSPQDLMALEQLPQMVAAGVTCFKIEGRLKGPEYVAATTAAYRAGVDAAWEQHLQSQQQDVSRTGPDNSSSSSSGNSSSAKTGGRVSHVAPEVLQTMAQVFSRAQDEAFNGLTPGFLQGSRHQRLVRGRAPRHRGLCLGRIAGFTSKGGVIVRGLLQPLKRGDGIVFDQGTPERDEQGGSVWELMVAPLDSDSSSSSRSNSSSNGNGKSRSRSSSGRGSSKPGTESSRVGKYVRSSGFQCRDGRAAAGDSVELLFAPDQVDVSLLSVGDLVWKNRDPSLEAQLRASYDSKGSTEMRKVPVQVRVSGSIGTALQLQLTDKDGRMAVADTGDVQLSAAVKRPMSEADVTAAVGQLGDNSLAPAAIDMADLDLDAEYIVLFMGTVPAGVKPESLAGLVGCDSKADLQQCPAKPTPAPQSTGLFLPASAWKSVRRAAAEQLLELRQQHPYADGLAEGPVLPQLLSAAVDRQQPSSLAGSSSSNSSSSSEQGHQNAEGSHGQQQAAGCQLRVLCRTPDQVSAALAVPWLDEVIVDFLEVHGLKEAVRKVKAAGKQVVVALPRILKPDESRLLWFYLKLEADALLLRGAGALQQLLELGGPGAVVHGLDGISSSSSSSATGGVTIPRLEGDFSLNAANVLSADLLLRSGLSRLCPTHDLNAAQLAALAEGLQPPRSSSSSSSRLPGSDVCQLEAVVHQHLPIFHTEHCVFCRFLSDGNDYRDCGHPCERHTVQLRDSSGADHLVLADMGCRNTVFNASAQSGLYYLPHLRSAGYGTLRVELVNEPAAFVRPLLEMYRKVLQGRETPRDGWRWLQDNCDGGVAAGSLEVKGERAVSTLRPSARRS